jgi:hypothetical protein
MAKEFKKISAKVNKWQEFKMIGLNDKFKKFKELVKDKNKEVGLFISVKDFKSKSFRRI